jgi:hypothetical protein
MADPKMVLHCDRADYTTGVIDDPYGLPSALVPGCIEAHEKGHRGHRVRLVPEEKARHRRV